MKILGIDPGYERLGIAIIEKSEKREVRTKNILVFSETFRTSIKDSHPQRLFEIQKEIERVIKKYKPDRLGIETLFFNKNVKTAIKVAEARGIILALAQKNNLKIFELSPQQIKIAVTGYGGADKTSMTKMIPLLVDIKKDSVKLDDEFDAIGAGVAGLAN
jgi:crossover junction endodeoxyribonuclease RuvC